MNRFRKKLPEWNKPGIEPPNSKKTVGWQVDERPPAEYLNWLANQTFESLKELQDNAAHKEETEQLTAQLADKVNQLNSAEINIMFPPPPHIGLKGDGIADDTQLLHNLINNFRNHTLFAPDGNFKMTLPTDLKDVALRLSKNARFFADQVMDYLFDFNTDRIISSVDDLSQNFFLLGGTLDGNGKARHVLRLNKFLNFGLDTVIKNGINRGLVVNNTGGLSAELNTPHLRFVNDIDTNISDNVAIENNGTDNHFGVIVVQDWTVGMIDSGNADIDSLHHWISHPSRFADSVTLNAKSNTAIKRLFADTIRKAIKQDSGNVRVHFMKTYYNTVVYTSSLQSSYPAKVVERSSGKIKIDGSRINANGVTNGVTFVDSITTDVEAFNNFFEGTVINSFNSIWSPFYTSGIYLYSGNAQKGLVGTSANGVFIKNITTNRQLNINDNGTITYNGEELQPIYALATSYRPTNPKRGMMVFDTTLGKPIWHNGIAWVDSTGTVI